MRDLEMLFYPYTQDINEVRSLVNLWREEFDRRIDNQKDLMERVQKKKDEQTSEFSESIKDKKVIKKLEKHLNETFE
jgi:hypothetical protein